MKSPRRTCAAFVAAFLIPIALFAADATGTWTWTQQGRGRGKGGGDGGGTPRQSTLKLVQKDGKLTGTVSSPGRDGGTNSTEISNGTIKDDVVAFTVEREFGGNRFVMKYSGKLAGDTITGETEFSGRDGQSMKREWVAKRAK